MVPEQASLGRVPERPGRTAKILFREYLFEDFRCCAVGDHSPVRPHVDPGIAREQFLRATENLSEELAVVLTVLELAADRATGAESVRRAAKKPETKPLIVMVVRDAVVRRRGQQQLCGPDVPLLHRPAEVGQAM